MVHSAWIVVSLLLALGCAAHPPPVRAQLAPAEPAPSIEVTGEATIAVVPDEFVVQVVVRSFGDELGAASEDNRSRVAALIRLARELGIDRRYIATDAMTVRPEVERKTAGASRIVGYQVGKRITVILHRASLLEPLVQGLLSRGADELLGIDFHVRDIDQVRARARLEATRDARRRAQAMARELGRRLGRPLRIEEKRSAASSGNFVYHAATPELGDSMAVGKIRVPSSVTVRFELAPRAQHPPP